MTIKFQEIEEAVNQLNYFFENLPKQIERLEKEVKECNLETSDILHLIELDNFNASDGYKHARDLQITRQKRRECKDELESLTELYEKMKTGRPIQHQMVAIDKLTKHRKHVLKSRTYTPRVRSDLKNKFVECNKKKQASKGE